MEAKPCGNCGKPGVAGACAECGHSICGDCEVKDGNKQLCPVCAPANLAAARSAEVRASGAERPLPGPGFVRHANLPGHTGLWGQLRRAWVFMREALTMAFRDKDLLLPPIFSIIASTVFLVGALLIINALGLWDQLGNEEEGTNVVEIVIALVTGFIFYSISYFFTGMTVHLINVHLRGRDAQLGTAFADALKNLPALLLLAGASAIVSVLTSRRRREGGMSAGDFAAGAIQRIWTVVVYLILPIIILEDAPFFKAFGRAKEIHNGNLVPIAIGEIGVIIVNRIIGVVGILLAVVGVVGLSVVGGTIALIPAIIVAGLWIAVVMAYTNFVRTAYYTCLYLWAVERAAAADDAAIPQPLAAAMAA
jgi:hypothetical protein